MCVVERVRVRCLHDVEGNDNPVGALIHYALERDNAPEQGRNELGPLQRIGFFLIHYIMLTTRITKKETERNACVALSLCIHDNILITALMLALVQD